MGGIRTKNANDSQINLTQACAFVKQFANHSQILVLFCYFLSFHKGIDRPYQAGIVQVRGRKHPDMFLISVHQVFM